MDGSCCDPLSSFLSGLRSLRAPQASDGSFPEGQRDSFTLSRVYKSHERVMVVLLVTRINEYFVRWKVRMKVWLRRWTTMSTLSQSYTVGLVEGLSPWWVDDRKSSMLTSRLYASLWRGGYMHIGDGRCYLLLAVYWMDRYTARVLVVVIS